MTPPRSVVSMSPRPGIPLRVALQQSPPPLPRPPTILNPFGAKIANALNHPVFFSGSHFLDSTQFGRISSVLVGARVIEFQLRYAF